MQARHRRRVLGVPALHEDFRRNGAGIILPHDVEEDGDQEAFTVAAAAPQNGKDLLA